MKTPMIKRYLAVALFAFAIAWPPSANGGGVTFSPTFGPSSRVQRFSTTGANTYVKPSGLKAAYVVLFGGGAGGGGGYALIFELF